MALSIETITPARATQYLATQLKNRKLRQRHIDELAKAMTNGTFLFSGDPIRFNTAGELIDGQHRLCACIQSSVHFDVVVITDIDPAAQDVIDTGIKRGPGDIFSLRGYTNAEHLSATLRWLWRFDTNQQAGYALNPQISDLDTALRKHPSVKDSLTIGIHCAPLIIKSLGAALHTLCMEKHPRETATFFHQFIYGEGLYVGDPAYVLRTRLVRNKTAKAKLPYHEIAALFVKAFNAHLSGRKIRTLRWITSGDAIEPFPTLGATYTRA